MPYKGIDDDQKKLSEFARGNIHPLNPPRPYSLHDDIVQALEHLLAEIKSGELEPTHLVIGWGEEVDVDGNFGMSYDWDAVGLETHELIGQLYTYATKLAMGEGE